MRLNPATRVAACFWIFGLLNNVLYVVILSAAVDLVGADIPKAVVLLADVLPSFFIKLTAPWYVHKIPYKIRIISLVALSFGGMQIVAHGQSLPVRLFGVVLASASSGLGEITFLALTHYFDAAAINGFSSGTGAAGLVGSFFFLLLTTWIHVSVVTSLVLFSALPFAFLAVYKALPHRDYAQISQNTRGDDLDISIPTKRTIDRVKPLVLPYIVPLMLVYIGEYTINQGIAPTLLFSLDDMPFETYRDAYVTYGTLYQIGVFISRSSAPWVRIRHLYIPAWLQSANVVICIFQALYVVLPSIYLLFALMVYEGLLGGAAYVNTYMLVSETVSVNEREFAMATVGVSDSAGIVVAGLISLWLEPSLCHFQVGHGRPWCTRT